MRQAIRVLARAALLCAVLPLAADTIDFEADSVSSVLAKGKEKTILAGNARLRMDSADIKADRIEILGSDSQYAFCSGTVSMIDKSKGLYIQTESLDYDRKKELSRMQGPTILEDKKNRVVIKGSFLENDGKAEVAVIQIGVRILKDDMVCRSEYALYRRKDKKLELTGLPVVVKGSDEYRAARITIDLDTDEIVLDGSVSGSVKQKGSPSPGSSPEPSEGAPAASPADTAGPTLAASPSSKPSPTATAPGGPNQ